MIKTLFRATTLIYPISFSFAFAVTGCGAQSNDGFSYRARFEGGGVFGGADPVLSPAGNRIVFAQPGKYAGLFAMSLNGKVTRLTTTENGYHGQPSISPDGRLIAFVSEDSGQPAIWLCDSDGANARQLTNSEFAEDSPKFSNSGDQIAFVRRMTRDPEDRIHDEVFVIEIGSGMEQRLTNDEYQDRPVRFGIEDRILYIESLRICDKATQGQRGKANLFSVDIGKRSISCVLQLGLRTVGSIALSADVKTVIYVNDERQDFEYDIFAVGIDGSNKRQLSGSSSYFSSVRYGFHSDKLVYLLDKQRSGLGEVHLYDLSQDTDTRVGEINVRDQP